MKQTNKTVLIKRSIENDGLPKNEGDYLCYEEVELSKLIEEMMPAKKKTSSLEKS